MAQTIVGIKAHLMREYYKGFSKYSKNRPHKTVAWVTAFTPVEILEALGINYYFPESYAAVIAASNKEQEMLKESELQGLALDCCSYSCTFNGSVDMESGPRGTPPRPDILIATNNQCNTLPNWWNLLSIKYNIPLIIVDYPGERIDKRVASKYVYEQHKRLIARLETLTGNHLDEDILSESIRNSMNSVQCWKEVIKHLKRTDMTPTSLFDDINFLITARCKKETSELYSLINTELCEAKETDPSKMKVFWVGYPLWYHNDRYLSEALTDCNIVGSNYITWWNLDYRGRDNQEALFNAYNYTFLNLTQKTRDRILNAQVRESSADCAIVLHNKSCKCDFVSAKNLDIPQAEIDIDMIDRSHLDVYNAKKQIDLLKEISCTE